MACLYWLFISTSFLLSQTKAKVYTSINGTYIGHSDIDKTFYEAERYCKLTYGSSLASIHSSEQASEIYELIYRVSYTGYSWIGLTDEYFYGHIYWTDGQPFNFSKQNLASETNKHCWRLRTNYWLPTQCNQKFDFICNSNPDWTEPLDLTFMPPVNVLGTSIDGSMTLFDHSATFTEADAHCQRMLGTHLISITNYEQAEQAQELCSRTTDDTLCWIGLTQLFLNAYEWTDGNNIGYYRWDSIADFAYDCTAIKSNSHSTIYSWTTNHCFYDGYKTIFICSTYPPTPNPTPTPTQHPITSNPTQYPSTAPTVSPYTMIEVTGNYLCSELADRIAIFYDISYDECIIECKHNYDKQCQMINHRSDTTPSRCYIFNKQCTINSNVGVSRIAFMGWKHFCVDYPIDWNDINGDACYGYTNVLNYCNNGNISVTVSEIESKTTDFNGIESCCGCGGGAELIDDITITFGEIQQNNYDLLCECDYGNPGNTVYKTWNNIMLYNLCRRLFDRTDIDCNQFIDKSYSGDINFISCDFTDYDINIDELYFLFLIKKNNATSAITTYINSDWFQLTQTLLPKTVNAMSYEQCITSLWATSTNIIHAAVPCNGDTTTTVATYTNKPTFPKLTVTILPPVTTTTIANHKHDLVTTLVTISGEMENEYILKTNDDSDNTVMVLLMLILLVVILIAIVVIGNVMYSKCKKTSGHENIKRTDALRVQISGHENIKSTDALRVQKSTETDALRMQMSNMNHVIEVDIEEKPLPKGWVQIVAPDKRVYYENNITKQTQWERPLKSLIEMNDKITYM